MSLELALPATERTTGTLSAGVMPSGTTTFTWYNPAAPGVNPANITVAGCPPIVTVTSATAVLGSKGAGSPAFTVGCTAPKPTQYITNTSPVVAGDCASARIELPCASILKITPCPAPLPPAARMAGFESYTARGTRTEIAFPPFTIN